MKKNNNSSCETCPSRKDGIFCNLNFSEIEDISHHKITNRYKKGQALFVQGTHPF